MDTLNNRPTPPLADAARGPGRVMTKRTRVVVGLLTAWALVAASPAAAQTGTPAQHRLLTSSHGAIVQANLFSSCRTVVDPRGTGMGICSDGFPTATATRLPVHGGGTVLVATGAPAYAITARYASANGMTTRALQVNPLSTSGRQFAVVLPGGPPQPLLLVSIHYPDVTGTGDSRESGDASFSVGLTEHRHAKLRPSGVTARARVRCDRARGQRRRCRLYERGKVLRPAGSVGDCRGGRVLVRVVARGRGRLRASARTSTDCRYRIRGRAFSLPSGVRTILVKNRFRGSSTLAAKRAPSIRIRLRLR